MDISNYSGVPSAATLEAWKAAGIEKVIIGTQLAKMTRQQLTACSMAGMPTEAYVYLWNNREPEAQIQDAWTRVQGYSIDRMWLDLEDSDILPSDFITRAVTEAKKHGECGIYTSSSWFRRMAGNVQELENVPLWYAHYDDIADFSDFEPFGGWQKPAMKQYSADVSFHGITVDLNVWRK